MIYGLMIGLRILVPRHESMVWAGMDKKITATTQGGNMGMMEPEETRHYVDFTCMLRDLTGPVVFEDIRLFKWGITDQNYLHEVRSPSKYQDAIRICLLSHHVLDHLREKKAAGSVVRILGWG